jgi:hypothetical protein
MHDQALMQITQQAGNGVDGLLNSVFSFLQRRTDYFYEAEPGDKMGFPPKYSEQLVSSTNFTNMCYINRSIATINTTSLNTRKSSRPKERTSPNAGRSTRRKHMRPLLRKRPKTRLRRKRRRRLQQLQRRRLERPSRAKLKSFKRRRWKIRKSRLSELLVPRWPQLS